MSNSDAPRPPVKRKPRPSARKKVESASGFPSLARNSAKVAGGLGAVPRQSEIEAGGLTWSPEDASPWGASIGYALASETTQETAGE